MTKLVDPQGRTTETKKNDDGFDISVSYPTGLFVEQEWENGLMTTRTYKNKSGGLMLNTTTEYYPPDAPAVGLRNKVKKVQSGTLPPTEYEYHSVNGRIEKSSWLDTHTEYHYNDSGHPTLPSVVATMSTSNPGMHYYTLSQYYPDGNVRSVSDGYGTVLFNYDAAGNPVSIKNARGFTTSFGYDKMGRVKHVENAKGWKTCSWYGPTGLLEYVSLPLQGECPAEGYSAPHRFQFAHDPMERLTSYIDPENRTESYTYNNAGKTASYTDRRGARLAYSYDPYLRMTGVSGAGASISFGYHEDSDFLSEVESTGGDLLRAVSRVETDYDELGRLTAARTRLSIPGMPELETALEYGYDENGRHVLYGDNEYVYDGETGLPEEMTSKGLTTSFEYDALYRLAGRSTGAHSKQVYAHNGQNRLERLSGYAKEKTTGAPERLIADYVYTYDPNGNITRIDAAGEAADAGVFEYEYDELDQLVEARRNGTVMERYWYDERGNIYEAGAVEHYAPGTNRLISDERCEYAYDGNGNMTLKECGSGAERVRYVFGYDWRNRMNEAAVYKGSPATLSHIVRYGYDAQGSRAWREKLDSRGERVAFEKYSYNGANVLADFDANNNATARYAMNGVDGLLYVQRGMKKYFYHTNHLGSVVAITDEDGDVVNRYLYTDSWGNFKLSCPSVNKGKPCIPNRYAYTGREWDADLDLYYYRARWYDPDTKRFTQEDEVFSSHSQYMYVSNNTMIYIDPFGRFKFQGGSWHRGEKGDHPGDPIHYHAEGGKYSGYKYEPSTGMWKKPGSDWEKAPNKFQKKWTKSFKEFEQQRKKLIKELAEELGAPAGGGYTSLDAYCNQNPSDCLRMACELYGGSGCYELLKDKYEKLTEEEDKEGSCD